VRFTASQESILVDDRFLGAGYGRMGAPERDAIRLFARQEGILLDPVYTGRAAAGMMAMIQAGEIHAGETVLFWHTGGTPGLWAYADQLR
jgi:L-cysteate sulfo-lyase